MSKRKYNQTCSVAGALDMLGERWTLLLVRELLTGPKRFTDLLAGLAGMGPNLLANRLRSLASDGLVTQRRLPPPAATWVYELSAAGRQLEPVLLELVRWGLRHQRRPGRNALYRPSWSVLAMRAVFSPEQARGVRVSCEFRVGADQFHAEVRDGVLSTAAGPAADPDAVITTEPAIFRRFEAGESPDELEKTRRWRLEGSRQALDAFMGAFAVPVPERLRNAGEA